MIEVEGLTKYYGRFAAIKDVNFKVQTGEIVGFLGPNGAGKTTTMRILTCFTPPSAGEARILGMDPREDSRQIRAKVGYLPENVPIYTWMRVQNYLEFVARAKDVPSAERSREIGRVMSETNIDDVKRKIIGSLSKGYRQRVGLAQALIGNPPILILDEPTIGLDPRQIREIRNLIKGFAENRTVILSTHILPEVSQICNRVIIINKGSVVAEDTPASLAQSRQGAGRCEIVVAAPIPEAKELLSKIPGVASVEAVEEPFNGHATLMVESSSAGDLRPQLARAIVEKGWDLMGLRAIEATLEDVFIDLVTDEGTTEEANSEEVGK
ncbi:MAG: ABC transporter ATP-binding protein [Thermodesulfobacteriota bacterium]